MALDWIHDPEMTKRIEVMSMSMTERASTEVVDVEALGKYAKEQLDIGEEAGREAFLPYAFRAIEALDKAKPTVIARGEETFTEYQARVTDRSITTINEWRKARTNYLKQIADSKTARAVREIPQSLRALAGRSNVAKRPGAHMLRDWTPDIDKQAKQAFREQVSKTIETARQEADAEKVLAKRLIDIGYKVLAKELHPDKGGNREAMTRLLEVKRRLYRAFNL